MSAEMYLEVDYMEAEEARRARDARRRELEGQGYLCESEDLMTIVEGRRVYVLRWEESRYYSSRSTKWEPELEAGAERPKRRVVRGGVRKVSADGFERC
jgi:hypothetical protein